ncbi:MAG TPA: hypothetical protein VK993_15205 [Chthoniobacterales bacterium]|nr:hypothetical protein [Chthoniobacterales bacterium]
MSSASFGPEEWDFSGLANTELIACAYWEYARESDFIRCTLRSYREWFLSGAKRDKASDRLFARMDRLQSIGDVSDVIIRGCCFPADAVWQSVDDKVENYRHRDADPITGSFPAPWQTLAHAERTCRSAVANHGKRLRPPPIDRGDHFEAEDIGKHCRARQDELLADYHRIQGAHPNRSEVELIAEGKLKPWPGIPPSLYWESGREVTVIRVAWADYTNDELVQYFRRWVKANRPPNLPIPSRRGRKPGDWRAYLTRLATMRLLSRFKPAEIFRASCETSGAVWNSKQFSGRKWHDTVKWHDARREARQIFHRLFPFLPPSEVPLSWQREDTQ